MRVSPTGCSSFSIRSAMPCFLIGGDKTGNDHWYEEYVPKAGMRSTREYLEETDQT